MRLRGRGEICGREETALARATGENGGRPAPVSVGISAARGNLSPD